MEVVGFVGFQDIFLCRLRAADRPAVQHHHLFRYNHVFRRIETVKVRQQEARGITDTTIAVRSAFEDLVRDRHFTGVVGGSHPQAQDIGAELVHHVLRANGVADRLGHFAAPDRRR